MVQTFNKSFVVLHYPIQHTHVTEEEAKAQICEQCLEVTLLVRDKVKAETQVLQLFNPELSCVLDALSHSYPLVLPSMPTLLPLGRVCQDLLQNTAHHNPKGKKSQNAPNAWFI